MSTYLLWMGAARWRVVIALFSVLTKTALYIPMHLLPEQEVTMEFKHYHIKGSSGTETHSRHHRTPNMRSKTAKYTGSQVNGARPDTARLALTCPAYVGASTTADFLSTANVGCMDFEVLQLTQQEPDFAIKKEKFQDAVRGGTARQMGVLLCNAKKAEVRCRPRRRRCYCAASLALGTESSMRYAARPSHSY